MADFLDALEAAEALEESKNSKKTKREKVMQVLGAAASTGSSSSSSSSGSGARQAPGMTQDDDGEEEEVLLGHYQAKIKGVQYYAGQAHVGEFVTLRREPTNKYDANAIEVLNLQNLRIGHMARETAAVLAGLLDRKMISIEATIPRISGTWEQAMTLSLYSSPQNFAKVREYLKPRLALLASLPPVGPAQNHSSSAAAAYTAYASAPARPAQNYSSSAGTAYASGPAVVPRAVPVAKAAPRAIVVAARTTVATGPKSQQSLELLLDSITSKKYAAVDQTATCGSLLTSTLFGHQLEGVAFLLAREKDTALPPFWSRVQEKGQTVFFNSITNSSQPLCPPSVKGGCLCDDMGLGKTLQLLALVVAHPPAGMAPIAPGRLEAVHQGVREAMREAGHDSMSSLELQQVCRKMKINAQGSKAELAEKIMVTLLEQGGGGAAAASSAASSASAAASSTSLSASASAAPPPKTTLIVCPISVIAGWVDQVRAHVAPHSLKIYNYSGAGRLADTDFLSSQDVIFVSYSTLANESSKGAPEVVGNKRARESQGLFHMPFWRVILDEAHTIRNRNTQMYKAVLHLQATNRWCVTGTPIQNKSDDAFPLFSFLRAAPCDEWSTFNRAVARPIKDGDPEGITRLRALLSTLSLRRNKDIIRDHLPSRTIEVHAITMSAEQRTAYDAIFQSARLVVDAALRAQGGQMTGLYSGVLECILRLRQACCDLALIPPDRLQAAVALLAKLTATGGGGASAEKKKLTAAEVGKLFAALKGVLGEDDSDCCVCLDPLTEDKLRMLRACRHTLCEDCCSQMLDEKKAETLCPLCRTPFARGDVLDADKVREAAAEVERDKEGEAKKAEGGGGDDEDDDDDDDHMPPKVIALLQGLEAMRIEDKEQKAVVFSQFTSYLNVLGKHLTKAGIAFARLDGTMSQKARVADVATWRIPNSQGGRSVLIISTRAGGQGLNLVEGNWCFMMDPLWNVAAEEQAMDRIYRLGQRRPVHVVRYVHEASIEQKILKLQESKAALNKGALSKLSEDEARKARLQEMINLFEL